jgi:hypothetical protein
LFRNKKQKNQHGRSENVQKVTLRKTAAMGGYDWFERGDKG